MHYYSFHIKDYHAATAHLSNEEDLCYRRLIDMYYETERPIPLETDWVSRRLRIGTDVVTAVLKDFFIQQEDGWHSARCDTEIGTYKTKVEVAQINGKLGGRPKKTQSVLDRNLRKTGSKANHEPLTNNQEVITTTVSHDKIVFDGSSFQNVNGQFAIWQKAYPALDIQIELNKAAAWIAANPKNAKSNYARFLTNWLSRAQDKAPKVAQSSPKFRGE